MTRVLIQSRMHAIISLVKKMKISPLSPPTIVIFLDEFVVYLALLAKGWS